MLTIDGSLGEGGGQVLRTALGLSLVTQTPFRITHIRAGRAKPGLLRQHLAAIAASVEIGQASVEGDVLGGRELVFRPSTIRAGNFAFSIGSAGSTSLVFQTVLPALLRAPGPSTLSIDGGTHNPLAPAFEFLDEAFVPLLARMGARLEVRLARYGFAPGGGGRLEASVVPGTLEPLHLLERGALLSRQAQAIVSAVPLAVARRELQTLQAELKLESSEVAAREVISEGPGNAVWVTLRHVNVTEVFVGFGEGRMMAHAVALQVAREARRYLATDASVGPHLADQLVIPLALAGEGSFRTVEPTEHTRTQLELIPRFLDVTLGLVKDRGDTWRVDVTR